MSKEFSVYTMSNGKRSRKITKFPRQVVNKLHEDYDKVSMRGTYKKFGYDIGVFEGRWPHVRRNRVCRFLQSHLGENIDNIYSEYINKIKQSHTDLEIIKEADWNWHDAVFIPGETKLDDIGWCPFTIDSEKRLIVNPKKNKNWHLGRW